MRIGFLISQGSDHQSGYSASLIEGMRRCGDEGFILPRSVINGNELKDPVDAICVWGWRNGQIMRKWGYNVLVMERAYVADRFKWVSLGWNGLNGRASWPVVNDSSRWKEHFAHLMSPWHTRPLGYALVMGQVPTDMAVRHIDFMSWAAQTCEELRALGHVVYFRAHPRAETCIPANVQNINGSLGQALADAAFTVTFNSNSGVDSIMNGVPTVTCDVGAMAYAVSSHDVKQPYWVGDRTQWASDMAWRQWLTPELIDGSAWRVVREALVNKELTT